MGQAELAALEEIGVSAVYEPASRHTSEQAPIRVEALDICSGVREYR